MFAGLPIVRADSRMEMRPAWTVAGAVISRSVTANWAPMTSVAPSALVTPVKGIAMQMDTALGRLSAGMTTVLGLLRGAELMSVGLLTVKTGFWMEMKPA